MSFKKYKIVMLPTKSQKTNRVEQSNIYLDKGKLYINSQTNYNRHEELCNPQHLYIISNDKIKKDDWVIVQHSKGQIVVQIKEINGSIVKFLDTKCKLTSYKKIIATTDTSLLELTDREIDKFSGHLPLPQLSRKFIKKYIKEYNKGNIIKDVLVKYKNINADWKQLVRIPKKDSTIVLDKWVLKINKDNTIIIKLIKNS